MKIQLLNHALLITNKTLTRGSISFSSSVFVIKPQKLSSMKRSYHAMEQRNGLATAVDSGQRSYISQTSKPTKENGGMNLNGTPPLHGAFPGWNMTSQYSQMDPTQPMQGGQPVPPTRAYQPLWSPMLPPQAVPPQPLGFQDFPQQPPPLGYHYGNDYPGQMFIGYPGQPSSVVGMEQYWGSLGAPPMWPMYPLPQQPTQQHPGQGCQGGGSWTHERHPGMNGSNLMQGADSLPNSKDGHILKREEVLVSKSADRSGLVLTLVSYNILAQYQLQNNDYLYSHCDPQVLEWPFRWANLLEELKGINADICCLQEVQANHYVDDIEPSMRQLGYAGVYQQKTRGKMDGCAMLYKADLFEIDTYRGVTFFQEGVRALGYDNVGQVLLLRPLSLPDLRFCVSNTHIFFNPNRGDVKMAQLIVLLAEIERAARRSPLSTNQEEGTNSKQSYWPIILAGDFNAEPFSDFIHFITSGEYVLDVSLESTVSAQNDSAFHNYKSKRILSSNELPPRCLGISDQCRYDDNGPIGQGRLSHALRLISCHDYAINVEQRRRLVTSFTSQDTCSVDHVFYAPWGLMDLISHQSIISKEMFDSIGGIPNLYHSSDHIPMVTKFLLRQLDSPKATL